MAIGRPDMQQALTKEVVAILEHFLGIRLPMPHGGPHVDGGDRVNRFAAPVKRSEDRTQAAGF
jgi:hypothetical protein